MPYTFFIRFTNDQLQTLMRSQSDVIVAQSTNGKTPNVAWQVIRPAQTNTLSWENQYGIYASTAQATNGSILTPLAMVRGVTGNYVLQREGVISYAGQGGNPHAFSLLNNFVDLPSMTVGLYLDAAVNGANTTGHAISAAPVPSAGTVMMMPDAVLYIWIQSQVMSNSVITNIPSPMTQFTLRDGAPPVSVAYDSASGKFIPSDPF